MSHSPFAIGKIGSRIVKLSLLISRATKVGIWTYEILRNSSELHPAPCISDVCRVHWLGRAVSRNKMFCLLFF